jgi:predicted metal-binding membrane protein
VPGRDRLVAGASLLGLAGLAWMYLWMQHGHIFMTPGPMGVMEGMGTAPPQAVSHAVTFLTWSVMMVGMMLPSALPAILLYGSFVRTNRAAGVDLPSIWFFAAGYLSAWTGFGIAATILQAALDRSGLLGPTLSSASPWLTGGLLLLAGVYQWLPLKAACLSKCRKPMPFFLSRWRFGTVGAFRMGAEHGMYCVGCCWALMLLMFAAGMMNLLWMALIAGFILVEKLFPNGSLIGRLTGVALGGAGVALVVAGA